MFGWEERENQGDGEGGVWSGEREGGEGFVEDDRSE